MTTTIAGYICFCWFFMHFHYISTIYLFIVCVCGGGGHFMMTHGTISWAPLFPGQLIRTQGGRQSQEWRRQTNAKNNTFNMIQLSHNSVLKIWPILEIITPKEVNTVLEWYKTESNIKICDLTREGSGHLDVSPTGLVVYYTFRVTPQGQKIKYQITGFNLVHFLYCSYHWLLI